MMYSRLKILWNDWPTLAATMAIPIVWGVAAAFPYLKRGAAPFPAWMPISASAVLAAIAIWRVLRVRWLFKNGACADGVITRLLIAKDRGRLQFGFEVDGVPVTSWMPIHKTKAVLSLHPGRRVQVLYDRSAPTCAIVRDLFSK